MSSNKKKERVKKAHKGDGKFPSKTIKHGQAEAARVKFGKDT